MQTFPMAWASFLCQTLESTSNTSELITKRVHAVMEIMHDEPIDYVRLISAIIKSMANGSKQVCGHFCVINELCRATGVPSYLDNKMIVARTPINAR